MKGMIAAWLLLWSFSSSAETLKIYNWKDYIEPDVISDFERDSGIKIDYKTYTTTQELDEALIHGGSYDLVVPSHYQMKRLIAEGRLLQIDVGQLVNYSNLDPKILSSLAGFDGASRYLVPYFWSTVGLVADRQSVEQALGKAMPNSWGMLFDGGMSAQLGGCGAAWLDAPEEVFSLWLNYRGKRLGRASDRLIGEVGQQMTVAASNLQALNNERYIEDMAAGRLCLAMAWSGHALAAAKRRNSLEFIIPEEGALMAIDGWAIPANAANPRLAYRFIDYMLRADIARRNTLATLFYSPLRRDLPEIRQLAGDHPELVPKKEERKRLYFLEELDDQRKHAIDIRWPLVKRQVDLAVP